MEDDWDSDFKPTQSKPQPVSSTNVPSGARTMSGHSVGRGRGFIGKAQETKSFINSSTSNTTVTNNSNSNGWNSGANNTDEWNDDGWNENTSSNAKNQYSNADSGWNSGGGGGGGGGSSYRSSGGGDGRSGGGQRSTKCFKCNEEGHMSRECPNAGDSQKRSGCFKCGEEGHMSRDCPNQGSGGGQRSNKCFKCNEEGHMSRDCPNAGDSQRRSGCFKCGEEGHMSRDCPNSGGGGGDRKQGGCFKCGEEGHMSRECPNSGGGDKKSGCFKCGEEGHMSRECPNGGGGDKKSGCFKCGEDGHMSRECPNAGGGGDRKQSGCFKCGEDGHMSKDCTNPPKTRTTVGEDGKPREIYVPPDQSEFNDDDDTSVPTGINFDKYDNIKVDVSGSNVPRPMLSFSDARFSPTLVSNIASAKYTKPTPVQKYTIPIVRGGRDLMACAQTGSGKTAAFLLPIIQMMFEAPDLPNNSHSETQEPWAVIVSPTRELAIQIQKEALRFARGSIVKVGLIYGGTSVGVQSQRLARGCHILVATVGRLDDFVNRGKVSFAQIKFFILDEADRMLEMGFGPSVRKMVEHPSMPNNAQRQTLLFSATFPAEIQKMAADFLKPDYLFLRVGLVGAANSDVTQMILQVTKFEKKDKLLQILQESGNNDRTLIFVETKRQADFIASFISQKNFICTSIHGDRLQREREEALNDFRIGSKPILTATSVAARGLDIKDVRHVINFDMPSNIDDYVHRIGRTGRVGNTGQSTSFFDVDKDAPLAADLIKILADAQQEVPSWLEALGSSGGYSGGASNFTASRDVRHGTSKSTWQNDNVVENGDESWD